MIYLNIQEAARRAITESCAMSRKEWDSEYRFRVEPTNTPDLCVCHSFAMKTPGRGWQPSAEDLIADDWYLVGKYDGSEFGNDI